MYSGGSGTALDPYLIATPQDFYNIRENLSAHFRQVADLDFANFGEFIAPDGDFTGVYDGGNFSIKNAEIKGGLFGTVSGSSALVQNIKLEDSNIASIGDSTGGIAREVVSNAIIQFCRVVKGKITATHNYVGGIVGHAEMAQIRFCWTDVPIESDRDYVGGITGRLMGNTSTTISNCYSLCDIFAKKYVGGIVGYISPSSSYAYPLVEKCLATGYVAGDQSVGGICGHAGGSSYNTSYSRIRNCFAINKGIIRNIGSHDSSFGRIYGSISNKQSIIDNYALSTMKFYPDGFQE